MWHRPVNGLRSLADRVSAGCLLSSLLLLASHISCQPTAAQSQFAPISLVAQAPPVTPTPQIIPTDATPFTVTPERNTFNPGYKFKLFQAMPERLYFTASTEVSQRLDTNVLFTARRNKPDYAFRVLPNLTIGYNIARNTSIFANYFVIKDVFAVNDFLNKPTTQSLAWGIQHNKQIGKKTNLQLTFQARELWQTRGLRQFDFIPGATVTHAVNSNNILYASALLQMRGGSYFVAPTRELDPFYTVGYIHRRGPWTFIATDTLVTNFRQPTFRYSVPNQSNVSMIADFEVNRPLSRKFPSVLAFARAEPIWNWGSKRTPGLSGFDFRFYTGLRFIVSKPSYYAATANLKKQLMKQQETGQPSGAAPAQSAPAASPTEGTRIAPPATTDGEPTTVVPGNEVIPTATADNEPLVQSAAADQSTEKSNTQSTAASTDAAIQ